MSHYIQDEKCCEIVENEHFGQFLYCNVCHKRCFESYSKAMSEIRRQHRSKKGIMIYVLGHTSATSAGIGILRRMPQLLQASALSGFASRRGRTAYPRLTDRLEQLSEFKTVSVNPTASQDIRRFVRAVLSLSHDVGSYNQHLYLHYCLSMVHTYSLLAHSYIILAYSSL